MAIQIKNNIPQKDDGALVENAVIESMGQPAGDWRVVISERATDVGYTVTIKGPDGFTWLRRFFGIDEQDPPGYSFIRRTVAKVLEDHQRACRFDAPVILK